MKKGLIIKNNYGSLPPSGMLFYLDFSYNNLVQPEFKQSIKKGKQIFCDIDPYGEENWEDE